MENLMESNWVEVKLDVEPIIVESCSAGFFDLGDLPIQGVGSAVKRFFFPVAGPFVLMPIKRLVMSR